MRPPLFEVPTSAFLLTFVQAFMLLCLFLALMFDVTELALFSLLILVTGLGARLWSRASPHHVKCEMMANRHRLFPGEQLKIGIRAVNAKFLPILLKIDLFIPRAVVGSEKGQWISEESGLLWYQQTDFYNEFYPNHRGVFDLGPPSFQTGDLFGFLFNHREVDEQFEIIVYPRIVDIRHVIVPKREFFGMPGAKSPVEDPAYLFGTRDYQSGSPARKIHWKASARHHRLQEKLCEPGEQEKVFLILDVDGFSDDGNGDLFETCLEVIASLALQLDRRGLAVGLATNGNIVGGGPCIIPISNHSLQVMAILETLARVGTKSAGPITDILSKGYRITWGVSCLYFILKESQQTHAAQSFMKHRNTPIQFVLARKSSRVESAGGIPSGKTVHLEEIRNLDNDIYDP